RVRRGSRGNRLAPIVLEQVRFEPLEADRLQEPRGDDAIGVDVVAPQGERGSTNLSKPFNGQGPSPLARTRARPRLRRRRPRPRPWPGSSAGSAPWDFPAVP